MRPIAQEFNLGTVVSGTLEVTIEEIGTFKAQFRETSLQVYAGQVYCVLTAKVLFDRGDFFELVSFDPQERKLVVRVKG